MGTNYYIEEDVCEHCGRGDGGYHIGKSSAGWAFQLHVEPEEGVNELRDIVEMWKGKKVLDEYGTRVSKRDMIRRIAYREDYMSMSVIGEYGCIGHGSHGNGTYDLIIGEFS